MKLALIGYGKMGKMIEELILQSGKHEIVLKVNSKNLNELTVENLQKAEAAIEFSNPSVAVKNIMFCIDAGVPIVTGTTGWYNQKEDIMKYCNAKNGTVIYASNFSIGVNIFFELNRKLAELMKRHSQYDVSMEEIHHTEKKDVPSGTAITLAYDILSINTQKKKWVNHFSKNAEELSIVSLRKPDVPGTHVVVYDSEVDEIEIKHTAFSRKGFAEGAILAAEQIGDKKGFFTFGDILNL